MEELKKLEDPDFASMSDEDLKLYLDQLRELNAKNSPVARKSSSTPKASKPKKDFIKVDLT